MQLRHLFEKELNLDPINIKKAEFSKIGPLLGDPDDNAQGYARDNKKTLNTVIKIASIRNPTTDVYLKFIKLAAKHEGNPFFPKIYGAKLYKIDGITDDHFNNPNTEDKDYGYKLVVHMEKLQHIMKPSIKDTAKDMLLSLGFKNQEKLEDMVEDTLDEPKGRADLIKNTKNSKLKQALRLLEPYFTEFDSDMHSGNVMIRLTAVGPQLVIIDPFILL